MRRALVLVALLQGGAACSGEPSPTATRWLDRIEASLPAVLSEVGVYADLVGRTPAADAVPFAPEHPLYSNGLEKERLLHLPAGAVIDATTPQYAFPDGTVLAKTFTLEGAPVETRLLFRRAGGWDYALYAWRLGGDEADLRPGNWPEERLSLPSGEGLVAHTLPARLDCRTCHETHTDRAGSPVLGIGPLQLDERLRAAGVVTDPAVRTPVRGRSEAETRALGYFVGNCISCHHGGDALNASFDLYPDAAVAETVGQPTEAEAGVGTRVVAGNADASVLYTGVVRAREPDYDGPFKAMPPLGVDVSDPAAEATLRSWIQAL